MTLQVTTIGDDDADDTTATKPVRAPDDVSLEASAHDGLRDAAVRDLLGLVEANRRLQETLSANAALCETSLLRLMDGVTPRTVLDDVDVARSRTNLAEALAGFERARHRARGTFIAAQFASGINMKEIGRRWGISRQLAHRFFNEARRDG